MDELALWALGLGVLKLGGSLFAVFKPARYKKLIQAFPRSVWPGRVLSAVALVWAAILLNEMPMGRFDSWKTALYVLCPLAIVLVPIYLDELLSPRALGGLFLLMAAPILDAARWHPSSLSVCMSLIAYIMVVFGMMFILTPYMFNRIFSYFTRTERRCRYWAVLGVLAGAGLLALGLFAY